jgi:hypothetical protein
MARGLTATVPNMVGFLENSRVLLRTPASAYIPIIAILLSSWRLKKRGKASKKVKERTIGRISLVVLYSRRLEKLGRQSPGVSMPQVGVLQLPRRVPPKAGTTCAYLS